MSKEETVEVPKSLLDAWLLTTGNPRDPLQARSVATDATETYRRNQDARQRLEQYTKNVVALYHGGHTTAAYAVVTKILARMDEYIEEIGT